MATGVSITPNSLEACHRLLSNQNDKVIIKFSRRKGAEMFLSKNKKKKTKITASNLAMLVLKVVKSLSMKVFATTISSYGVYVNIYGQWNVLKLSALTFTKSKYQNWTWRCRISNYSHRRLAEIISKLRFSV